MKTRPFHKIPLLRCALYSSVGMATMILSANAASVLVNAEATIEAGASADLDEDEAAAGYVFVKYTSPVGNATRKAYFQFDLTGQNADLTNSATFTLSLQSSRAQALKFWVLNDAYAGFASTETWNNAQANETETNDLLTGGGGFTATQIGDVIEFNGATGDDIAVNPASLSPYVFGDKITFAISGADWTGPDNPGATVLNGGMRFVRNDATLDFSAIPEPSVALLSALGMFGLLSRRR